jgi:hypothetical protein
VAHKVIEGRREKWRKLEVRSSERKIRVLVCQPTIALGLLSLALQLGVLLRLARPVSLGVLLGTGLGLRPINSPSPQKAATPKH